MRKVLDTAVLPQEGSHAQEIHGFIRGRRAVTVQIEAPVEGGTLIRVVPYVHVCAALYEHREQVYPSVHHGFVEQGRTPDLPEGEEGYPEKIERLRRRAICNH